jgi:hypothetical protein
VCSVLSARSRATGSRSARASRDARRTRRCDVYGHARRRHVSSDGDGLLVAIGRRPNIPAGTTERAGIALDARGFVRCDEHLRRRSPDITRSATSRVSRSSPTSRGKTSGGCARSSTAIARARATTACWLRDVHRAADRAASARRSRRAQAGHRAPRRDAPARDVARGAGVESRRGLLPPRRRSGIRRDPRRHVRRVRSWRIDPRDPRPHGGRLELARSRTLGAHPPDVREGIPTLARQLL